MLHRGIIQFSKNLAQKRLPQNPIPKSTHPVIPPKQVESISAVRREIFIASWAFGLGFLYGSLATEQKCFDNVDEFARLRKDHF